MNLKKIKLKEISEIVAREREAGKTDQEIYNQLSPVYDNKKRLALAITGTVTTELKEKYKVYNNLLIGLLTVGAITKVLSVLGLVVNAGSPWFLLLLFIAPLLNLLFAYYVAQYQAHIYRACGLLMLINSMQILNMKEVTPTGMVIALLFAGCIAALSFFLDFKMFPDFKPNKLQKDSNGEYILPTS